MRKCRNKLSNNKLWAICKINNQVGAIDTDGAILVPCKFKTIKDFLDKDKVKLYNNL